MKIGLFGTGAYGMALSSILVENNCEVVLWTKFEEEKNCNLFEEIAGNQLGFVPFWFSRFLI